MNHERTYVDYLSCIVDTCEKVAQFIAGMTFEAFANDVKTQSAAARAFEIVGEATKRIPQPIPGLELSVPWRAMAGMRDKLSHDYIGVNVSVVWKTGTEDLPAVEPILRRMVAAA